MTARGLKFTLWRPFQQTPRKSDEESMQGRNAGGVEPVLGLLYCVLAREIQS